MKSIIILIDTNVLYHSMDYKINIQDAIKRLINKNHDIYVHSYVEKEIMNDLLHVGKRSNLAKFAMMLMQEFQKYEDTREYSGTDIALLATAKRVNGIVLTYDKGLRDRCQKESVPVISNFVKGKLQLIGYVD